LSTIGYVVEKSLDIDSAMPLEIFGEVSNILVHIINTIPQSLSMLTNVDSFDELFPQEFRLIFANYVQVGTRLNNILFTMKDSNRVDAFKPYPNVGKIDVILKKLPLIVIELFDAYLDTNLHQFLANLNEIQFDGKILQHLFNENGSILNMTCSNDFQLFLKKSLPESKNLHQTLEDVCLVNWVDVVDELGIVTETETPITIIEFIKLMTLPTEIVLQGLELQYEVDLTSFQQLNQLPRLAMTLDLKQQ
jgi:hypothetical protein